MPLAGSLPDLDADGSRYSMRPARLVRLVYSVYQTGLSVKMKMSAK